MFDHATLQYCSLHRAPVAVAARCELSLLVGRTLFLHLWNEVNGRSRRWLLYTIKA